MKFYLSAAAGALGVVVTLLFIPEITTLNLREGDLRWDAAKRGTGASPHAWQLLLQHPAMLNAGAAALSDTPVSIRPRPPVRPPCALHSAVAQEHGEAAMLRVVPCLLPPVP